MAPEVHLLVQSHVHFLVDLYIDLEVHLYIGFQVYHQVHIKRIYIFSDALSSPDTPTNLLLLSYFQLVRFCIHLHPYVHF